MKSNRRCPILRRTGRGLWLLLLLLLAFWTGMSVAPAAQVHAAAADEQKTAARAEVQKAQLHYKLGRFDEALAGYSRAYEMFNAPALLFNIGQCHKNLKNYERAIFFFEGYLREETKPDSRKRTLAEELIAESRAELERQRAAAAAEVEARRAATSGPAGSAPVSSVAAVFGAPPPLPSVGGTMLDASPRSDSLGTEKSLTRKWWFWTAIGVGALAVVGGTIAYYGSAPTTTTPPPTTLGTLDRR